MKRLVSVLLLVLLIFSCTACSRQDKVLSSLGEYDDYVFYTQGEFQDYTDYAKYYYTSANIAENKYFAKIQDDNLVTLNEHLDNFEICIESYKNVDASYEIVVNYDFDRAMIDTEDYIYIYSEKYSLEDENSALLNYDIYFFDTQTLVLYYFHNNI